MIDRIATDITDGTEYEKTITGIDYRYPDVSAFSMWRIIGRRCVVTSTAAATITTARDFDG